MFAKMGMARKENPKMEHRIHDFEGPNPYNAM